MPVRTRLSAALLILATTLPLSPHAPAQVAATAPGASEALLTEEGAQAQLDAARSALEAVAADAADDSPEGLRRGALRRRVALLEEYLALRREARAQTQTAAGLEGRLAEARSGLSAIAGEPEPQSPDSVTKEEFDALEQQVAKQQALLTSLQGAAGEARRRIEEELPRIANELSQRAAEAEKRGSLIAQQLAGASGEDERATLEIRIENARLDGDVAREAQRIRDEEAKLLQELDPVLGAEIDLAEKKLARLQRRLALAGEVLEGALARERAQADAELARKERAVEQAAGPAERFVAEYEARLARAMKNAGDAEATLLALRSEVSEQTQRLATEKAELAALRELISQAGTSGMAEERIRVTLAQAMLRRKLIERAVRTGAGQTTTEYRARRFTIDDTLFGIVERYAEERAPVLAELPEAERAAFVVRTDELLSRLRTALREEKAVLTEVIALGQEIQSLYLQRMEVLSDLERFIRSRAFWLRDGRPLGPEALRPLPRELDRLGEWLGQVLSGEAWAALGASRSGGTALLYTIALLIVVPVALMWARQRLRGATRRVNDRVVSEGRTPALMILVLITGVLSAALFPAYLVIAAHSIASAGLPRSVSPVLVTALEHAGYLLFLWFLSRSFFARRSIAEVQFGMPHEAANAFYRSIRWFLLAYLVGLLPWLVFSRPPFEFQAITRIAYLLFLGIAAVGVAVLVHHRSAFVRHRLELVGEGFFSSHWRGIGGALTVLAIGVVALDVGGFRYAAGSIGKSFAWTLVTLVVLPPLYVGLQAAVQRLSRRIRPRSATAFGVEDQDGAQDSTDTARRVVDFLRLVMIVAGVFLIASFWGFDQRALETLDELQIYAVRGAGDEQEFVTAADVARAILILIGTFWTLRVLPGVYEFAVFPRLGVDEGVKYAALTISRYTVFVLGLFLALAEVHLDLGRLGWLMAAIGVGLGFGLQEIVSNFVSGVILLIERPVRPGDVVTVGSITGTVQRINIRATTILNFDRQEVMLPNRSLITSEVTNWTRGDTVNRLVISIGVAYGSDVDEVSELLLDIARAQPEVLTDPAPSVVFMNHGESSLDFDLRVFVPSPSEIIKLRDRINKLINKEFAKRNIEIPFPQRDLHIRSGQTGMSEPILARAAAD